MVSIVIPAYNRRNFIGETVDSVLAQTYNELEVIVVDDGSTDGTGDYLRSRYAGDSRFHYIWQENAERSVARNTGIKAAKGEYVAFLDSDDVWLSGKLDAQMRLLLANPKMVMAVTWYEFCDEHCESLQVINSPSMEDVASGDFAVRMVAGNQIGSPTPVIKRQVLLDAGMFCLDSKVLCFEDWELWSRVCCFGKVGVVPAVLARHRIHPGNSEKPIKPENYIASVANMQERLSRVQWAALEDMAVGSYWARLRTDPPRSLYRRTQALAAGVSVFGKALCAEVIGGPRGAFIRFLVGPVMFRGLRRLKG